MHAVLLGDYLTFKCSDLRYRIVIADGSKPAEVLINDGRDMTRDECTELLSTCEDILDNVTPNNTVLLSVTCGIDSKLRTEIMYNSTKMKLNGHHRRIKDAISRWNSSDDGSTVGFIFKLYDLCANHTFHVVVYNDGSISTLCNVGATRCAFDAVWFGAICANHIAMVKAATNASECAIVATIGPDNGIQAYSSESGIDMAQLFQINADIATLCLNPKPTIPLPNVDLFNFKLVLKREFKNLMYRINIAQPHGLETIHGVGASMTKEQYVKLTAYCTTYIKRNTRALVALDCIVDSKIVHIRYSVPNNRHRQVCKQLIDKANVELRKVRPNNLSEFTFTLYDLFGAYAFDLKLGYPAHKLTIKNGGVPLTEKKTLELKERCLVYIDDMELVGKPVGLSITSVTDKFKNVYTYLEDGIDNSVEEATGLDMPTILEDLKGDTGYGDDLMAMVVACMRAATPEPISK